MIETVAIIGVLAVVVGFGVFVGLAPESEPMRARDVVQPRTAPSKFFVRHGPPEVVVEADPLPAALVLSRLERHVRQEQAAAEVFLCDPSGATLRRGSSSSPLVN